MKKLFIVMLALLAVTLVQGQTINDCSTCGKQLLTNDDIEGKSLEELALLRNEIFARHGYVFNKPIFQNYFEGKPWYKEATSNNDVKLTATETKNVDFLKTNEARLQKKRDAAIRDLKKLKKALNDNNQPVIDAFLRDAQDLYFDSKLKNLKLTLNKVNLEDVGWNNGRALYSVTVDNGFSISAWRLRIDKDEIKIEYGEYAHSEIFGDFDDGYSEYRSEGEYLFWWVFTMTDNGIVFKEINGAG